MVQQPLLRLAPSSVCRVFACGFFSVAQRTVNVQFIRTLRSLQFITLVALLCEVLSHLDNSIVKAGPLMSSRFKFLPPKLISAKVHSTSIFSLQNLSYMQFSCMSDSLLSVRFTECQIAHVTSAVRGAVFSNSASFRHPALCRCLPTGSQIQLPPD